jgi:hypothetical protein
MPDRNPTGLAYPGLYLFRMAVFLALGLLLALVLEARILAAFAANPGLNGLIIVVLILGIVFAFAQVGRLYREIRWVNRQILPDDTRPPPAAPILLAPVAALLGQPSEARRIAIVTLRSMLDSIGGRLDESRDIGRYMTGLLVFLGLLGTFWGLIETIGSIGGVIASLQGGGSTAAMFDELKAALGAPLAGMGIAFSSSLFGLAGSLILGFLDLQTSQAQSRFFYELEEWLSAQVAEPATGPAPPLSFQGEAPSGAAPYSALAEGINALVREMRAEQQMLRSWVEAQASQQAEMRKLIERLEERLAREADRGASSLFPAFRKPGVPGEVGIPAPMTPQRSAPVETPGAEGPPPPGGSGGKSLL